MFRHIILPVLITAIIFLGGYFSGDYVTTAAVAVGAPTMAPFKNDGIQPVFKSSYRNNFPNQAVNFVEEFVGTNFDGSGSEYSGKKQQKMAKKKDHKGEKGEPGQKKEGTPMIRAKNCKKFGDAIITILSYNQSNVFVVWTEVCKEMGKSETHCVGYGVDDDIAVKLPQMVTKISLKMQRKYGDGCFQVYCRYTEVGWDGRYGSKKDGPLDQLAVTKMLPVGKWKVKGTGIKDVYSKI